MQSLGYTRFRAAGFSQGAVYAMALAYYAQVSALALISGRISSITRQPGAVIC